MKVPFVDLLKQQGNIRSEIIRGFESVLDKTNFILGEEVSQFEKRFAEYCGAKYAVGVASGLDAIHLTLRALGIGAGDEVLVPAHTFIATALGVTQAGATPVFVDVDEKTFLMDLEKTEKAITPKTKALLPVHLYGRALDLKPFSDIAQKYKLHLVEDAAQAHGASINGTRAGNMGVAGCFSFYPGKNLGCYGDGGAVTTNDASLKDKLEALRNYGSPKKYHHPITGYNSRLDTLQAVVLNAKLPYLDSYNSARWKAALKYNEALRGVGDLFLPEVTPEGTHVFHLYVVRTKNRNALLDHLQQNGVSAGIHYPVPMHLHGAYDTLGYKKGSFPVSERLCDEILSLPMFPELTDEQIAYTAGVIRSFYGHTHRS